MYCINCGVELADSEKKCPLCGTSVFHPELSRQEAERPFPDARLDKPELVNRSGLLFVITVLAVLSMVTVLLCDWRINGDVVWSGYAAGGVVLVYVMAILPLWFRSPNPVIFISADFAAIALYLLYIDHTVGGAWFLSFALPVTAGFALLLVAVVALLKYVRRGYLFIFGGALMLGGGLMVLLEYLINCTFHVREVFFWSFYPLAAGFILGLMLIIIGVCPSLRESLRKKFFL